MGPICNSNWSTSGMRITLSYLRATVFILNTTFENMFYWYKCKGNWTTREKPDRRKVTDKLDHIQNVII